MAASALRLTPRPAPKAGRTSLRPRSWPVQIPPRKLQKRRPVRRRRMPELVLPERQIALQQRPSPSAETPSSPGPSCPAAGTPAPRPPRPETRPSGRPTRLRPCFDPTPDKHRPRRAQRNQLMRIHRQVARRQRPGILHEVPRHPVVERRRGGQVFQLLAHHVPVELVAARRPPS